jgi:sugar phosphate isomerase/epimerase
MTMPDISYQLYSSRNFPDLARQAAMLAGLGIRHAEPFGGLFGDMPALQAALAENGLSAPTAHVGAPALRSDFAGMVARLKALGVATMIVPAVPPEERVQPREGWQALGRELAGWARRAADEGLGFGWHNHHFEFAALPDGSYPLEHILGDDPLVKWQCDIAWVIRGQQDPAHWIRRYQERVFSFHVKDLAAPGAHADEDGWADVGHGVIDWPALLPVMRACDASVWTLEHDNPSDDARFARRALATVQSW